MKFEYVLFSPVEVIIDQRRQGDRTVAFARYNIVPLLNISWQVEEAVMHRILEASCTVGPLANWQ